MNTFLDWMFLAILGGSLLLTRSQAGVKRFLGRWVSATSIGWPVGLFLAFPLSYGIVNQFYPKETNLILGLCIGAGVGFSQQLIIKKHLKISTWWIWASAIGIGLPFVVGVILDEWSGREIRFAENEIIDRFILGVLGGLLTGMLQVNMVRSFSQKGIWWLATTPLAWGFAFLSTGTGTLGFFISGGVSLGIVSGIAMVWLLRQKDIDKAAEPPKPMETLRITPLSRR